MSDWIRRIAITLAVVLSVLGAGAFWLGSRFDPSEHQRAAVAWMKDRHDRTLNIGGPVQLSLFPWPVIHLVDISLSEAGRPETFAAVDGASLSLALMPLLRGELVVSRVEAHGVRTVLLRNAKGGRNVDDLLGPVDAGSPAKLFKLSRFVLSDVRARVKDDLGGVDGELVLKELSAGRIASQVESTVKLVAQLGFKSPAWKGELRGTTRFTPDLATGSIRLSDMNLDYRGDAPGASSIDATLRGLLAWDGASSSMSGEKLSLRIAASTAGLRLAGSVLAIERFALNPARKSFAIDRLKLRIKGSQVGKPLALDLDWPGLDVTGETLTGSALSGKFSIGSEVPLSVSFKSGAPSGDFDNVRVPAFEATVTSSAEDRRVSGNLRSELVMQRASQSALLDKIDLRLRVDEPGLKPLALSLQGAATVTADDTRWNLAGDINANRFNTEGSGAFGGITPNVKATLRFQSLDLNGLLRSPPMGSSATDAKTPIDLDSLRSLNGNFAVRIGSLVLRQFHASDVSMDGTAESGMLRVSSVRGKAWSGLIDGSAFADARASRVALRARADGVNIAALLKDMTDHRILVDGNGRIDVDIESAGRTVGELESRLKGKAALNLRDGAFGGIDLERTLGTAPSALAAREDAVIKPARLARAEKAEKAETTPFMELSAGFTVEAGVARTGDLYARLPHLRLDGEGVVDIVKGRIESGLRATLIDAPKSQDAGPLAALKGLEVPLQLSGPLDAVNWKLQWSGVSVAASHSPPKPANERRTRDSTRERQGNKPLPGPTARGAPAAAAAAAPAHAAAAAAAPSKAPEIEKLKGPMP